MVLIDRVTHLQPHTLIQTETDFPADHWVFKGHFKNFPILPGFLAAESMAQAACLLVNKSLNLPGDTSQCYLMSAERIRFMAPVKPGRTLMHHVRLIRHRGDYFSFRGTSHAKELGTPDMPLLTLEAIFLGKMISHA